MRKGTLVVTVWLSAASVLASARPAAAQFYRQHNLISDGAVPADLVDPDLVNAWGLAAGPTSPWWIADNGTGRATVYNVATGSVQLTVTVPGAPTGLVFNEGPGFIVSDGVFSGSARFLFASEDGTISGWSPAVPPPPLSTQAFVVVDKSTLGAVYKGLAIAKTSSGDRLYATDFHNARVDVFDGSFNPVPGGFTDPSIPEGFAPFGIANLRGTIYVTYALQDEEKEDDVPGEGHGFINAFDTAGNLLRRVASRGRLNSPWGLTIAPADFGMFSGHLLVGNFGDGHINAFDLHRLRGNGESQQRGQFHSADGRPIAIDGLWALAFGNGTAAGPTDTLFFTAGPLEEQHGLFGTLVVAPPPGG